MNTIENIQKRRSNRTFTGEPLRKEHTDLIRRYIDQLQTPFGIKARIELISIKSGSQPIKLGTYGWIKGASDYLVLIYEKAPFAETAAAYIFEQAILYCTQLGLGTCWLGGTFNSGDFKKQITLSPNETIRVVSPVGYASNERRFLDKYIIRADKNHVSRKAFGELFFDNDFSNPLTEINAGPYSIPLEMVRLAPSANNKQEWRALINDKVIHFYKKPYPMFDAVDMGIALCHFELSCRELGIKGKYEQLKEYPKNEKFKYVISYVNN